MPDWRQPVRERLAKLNLAPGREADIVDEIAQHLADTYAEALAEGARTRDLVATEADPHLTCSAMAQRIVEIVAAGPRQA